MSDGSNVTGLPSLEGRVDPRERSAWFRHSDVHFGAPIDGKGDGAQCGGSRNPVSERPSRIDEDFEDFVIQQDRQGVSARLGRVGRLRHDRSIDVANSPRSPREVGPEIVERPGFTCERHEAAIPVESNEPALQVVVLGQRQTERCRILAHGELGTDETRPGQRVPRLFEELALARRRPHRRGHRLPGRIPGCDGRRVLTPHRDRGDFAPIPRAATHSRRGDSPRVLSLKLFERFV
jgi:hypothetical protein